MRAYKDYRRREARVASRQVGAGGTTRSGDGKVSQKQIN